MLIAAGLILLALGVVSGAFLVLFAIGMVGGAPGMALWIFFPVFTILGYLLAAAPARDSAIPMLSRVTGTLLLELQRQKKRWGIVTMCIGGGMGAAGLFEAAL